jgi:hypothetical protein
MWKKLPLIRKEITTLTLPKPIPTRKKLTTETLTPFNIMMLQYNDANDTSMATSSNNFDHSDNLGDYNKIQETSNDR